MRWVCQLSNIENLEMVENPVLSRECETENNLRMKVRIQFCG